MELLDQKLTYTIEKGWIIFNVTRAAELWISSAAKNYGLLIDIISGTGMCFKELRKTFTQHTIFNYRPYISQKDDLCSKCCFRRVLGSF